MKKIKTGKRIVSLVLTLIMLVSYIPATVWAVDTTTDIKAIQKPTGISIVEDYDDYFGADWVEKLELPETVKVTLANGSTTDAAVAWDLSTLDTRTTGYYSVPGEVTLPAGATNSQNLKATITIQVAEKKNLLSNGNFTNGTTAWKGQNLSVVTDPKDNTNKVASIKHEPINAGDTKQSLYTNMGKEPLADAINAQGSGQYALQIKAMPAAYDANTAARSDLRIRIYLRCYETATSSTAELNHTSNYVYMTSTTEWTECRVIMNLKKGAYVGYRADAYCTSANKNLNGALYVDDFELIALKTELQAEPSSVEEIKTEILSRVVALNYPDYVGEDWKTALGLPKSVEVLTDNGSLVDIDVTWSYAGLDFTKYGKYTLVGKLDDSGFPNPKGLTVQQNIYVTNAKNLLVNGDFNNGTTDWRGQNLSSATDPKDNTNQVISIKHEPINVGDTKQSLYTNMGKEPLANAINAQGSGQYALRLKAMPAAYDANTAARDDLRIKIYLRCYETATSSAAELNHISDYVYMTSTTEWTECTLVVDLEKGKFGGYRADAYCTSANKNLNGALYVDDFELIPLNFTIPKDQEPADVEEIITEIPVRAVVQDYNKYVGAGWQTSLGLPEQVEVRTSNGNTAFVDVIWDYEPLDLSTVGKYTLIGTLDNSAYPNPKELYVTQVIYIREYKNLLLNYDFNNGTNDWRGQNLSSATDPKDNTNKVISIKHEPINAGDTKQSLYTNMDRGALADAINAQGSGQYALRLKAMPAAYDANTAARDDLRIKLYLRCYETATSSAAELNHTSDYVYMTSTTEWTQCKLIVDLEKGKFAGYRADAYCTSANKDMNGALYVDDFELIPLNVSFERYEGEMEQVETVIPERRIIQNYQNYIGGSYTAADLRLPGTVKVRSTTGQVVDIEVKWDLSKLDLTKTGTYKIPGVLDQMRLDNPNALTVVQVIHVVGYKNLLSNPSFEDYGDMWVMSSDAKSELGIMSPVKHGSLAMQIIVERLDDVTKENIHAMRITDPYDLGLRVTASGAGQYYFGGWTQGTADSTDMQFYTRLWYRTYENGDSSLSYMGSRVTPSTKEYQASGSIVELPGDIYWTRLDVFLGGGVEAMRNSHLYVDHMELIPLNVEVPSMNDIIFCEEVANVYAHQGTKFEDLELPETVETVIKTGQYFQIPVIWDKAAYNPNKIGEQTITGTLDVGAKFRNTMNFALSIVVTIRAKGEDLRQTIYISTSGNEENDGLSPAKPKKEITNIPTYLAQGYNVRLKKGDTWYVPELSLTLTHLLGTEQAPLTITSYGEGARPIIAFMKKIENSAWKLVDEKRNVYAADVSDLGTRDGESVHRCFTGNEAYFHVSRSNYVALEDGEFCSYNKTIYLRLPAGEVPNNIEVTPLEYGASRIKIQYASYLTFEDLHFKGGSVLFPMFDMNAPTKYVKITKSNITHNWNHIAELEANDERIHYKPEFSYLDTDTMLSERQGAVSGYYGVIWRTHSLEGITMRDGVEGAWIHHNHMRQLSHGFVAIESLDRTDEYKTRGVYGSIIEDNVFEAGNALYSRCFSFSSGFNLSGTQMCRDNTYRRNKAYGMTVANHFFGENNIAYSNLISYIHTTYNEDGTLFDGKSAQSFGFNTAPWSDKTCVGNILINNTFYDVTGAAYVYDQAGCVYNNLYANNLVVNWKADPQQPRGGAGAIYDNTIGLNYVMHNGVYSHFGEIGHFLVDMTMYSVDEANNSVVGYKGNISADPKFLNVDMSLLGKDVRQDFTLSNESPMRYAGLSLYDPVFESLPAWERLKAEYTDINGELYLAESPSIGAWSFNELIRGDVAEVGKLDDILCRPGATVDQLMLPDSVPAVNDQGIDVVLLVTWDTATFDSSKPGTVTLTGELRNGPHTDLNINGRTATINVNVKDKLELMNIVTRVDRLTVLYGTSFEDAVAQLPDKLHVVEESGFEEDLPVTWTCMDYDGNKPGDYTFVCVLPEDMLSNTREFTLEVTVRVMHQIGRGEELLINPDFIEGSSAAPWALGWLNGQYGNFRITTDPELLPEGEAGGAIITVSRRYASIQQDVTGQMKLMGDGKYLFRVKMRAFDPAEPIDSSYPCLQQLAAETIVYRCRPHNNIGTEYVDYYKIMDVQDALDAQSFVFHTSTMKSFEDAEDGPRTYIIAGCSLIYLGKTDAEVEATLDSLDLTWNAIKGENGYDQGSVMSDLQLPSSIGAASTIKWTSSDESVITNDGKVIMGRVPKTVTMIATITCNGVETIKKYMVTVPRNPDLPTFSGSLTGSQKAQVGDEVSVTIKLNAENATAFNAYRFTLSYNVTRLEYVGISDPASTVELDGGRVIISGIGAERPITDTITVTFKVLKSGVTEVKLVKVEMDIDPNASLDNLPTMTVTDGAASIDVEKSENDKQDSSKPTVESGKKDDSAVLWIVIGLVAAALIAGGVIVIILIKKKKQLPPATEE